MSIRLEILQVARLAPKLLGDSTDLVRAFYRRQQNRFESEVAWDTTKPNGQPRRMLDTSRALRAFGWKARIPFEEGLRETVEWFEGHRKEIP